MNVVEGLTWWVDEAHATATSEHWDLAGVGISIALQDVSAPRTVVTTVIKDFPAHRSGKVGRGSRVEGRRH